MKVTFRSLSIPAATLVANEFIDRYMAKANGEYVKVYLYLLRHAAEDISCTEIADALDLTEGDVNRAVGRWKTEGLISVSVSGEEAADKKTAEKPAGTDAAGKADQGEAALSAGVKADRKEAVLSAEVNADRKEEEAAAPAGDRKALSAAANLQEEVPFQEETPAAETLPDKSAVDIGKLRSDKEFSNLLYVVQRYLSKIFSQTDTETIAYLYDVLKIPAELIEYLAEMCAEREKTSLRYLERIAIDWHTKGIRTVEQARAEAGIYTGEMSAVVKAFGLGRKPGEQEQKLIIKWFKKYGFTKEIVKEACNRTLASTQKPNFQYADSILTRWHDANVRTPEDIKKLDEEHDEKVRKIHEGKGPAEGTPNRFGNFEQRKDDLDSLVVDSLSRKFSQS
jgi:DnaD/phage-associated family protein